MNKLIPKIYTLVIGIVIGFIISVLCIFSRNLNNTSISLTPNFVILEKKEVIENTFNDEYLLYFHLSVDGAKYPVQVGPKVFNDHNEGDTVSTFFILKTVYK